MEANIIYDNGHRCIMFGGDQSKPEKIIDTNQYMVQSGNRVLLIDPGGIEIFAPMLASCLKYAQIEQITDIFASHQDPDIISSLGMWDQVLHKATLHSPWLWEGFIRHFGMYNTKYSPIADRGGSFKLNDVELQFIPAHYLHSSGNFHVYDPKSKIYFIGDVGASLEPGSPDMFVDDFESHTQFMAFFHQRWMPSNQAKNEWINRVRKLDIDYMCPQHGRLFKGEDVKKFLDWFEKLDVGNCYMK